MISREYNPVLAMYDVRGKQEFIFRTNKLQEIIGGSWIIRDIFDDYLYDAAKKVGGQIYNYKKDKKDEKDKYDDFTLKKFKTHMEEGYIGEVLYEGGGNFQVLFVNEEVFKAVTYQFTKTIMETIGTLRVLGTCVEASEDLSDYKGDRKKLYDKHRRQEAEESNIAPWACLPIVQVDRKTSQPLVEYAYSNDANDVTYADSKTRLTIQSKGIYGKLSKESTVKLLKYHKEMQRIKYGDVDKLTELEREFYKKNEMNLDTLVTEKGRDSQLAIIYIDGNNMGARVSAITKNCVTYEDSLKVLREFSSNIQKTYVEKGVEKALQSTKQSFRVVVSAGDEINFIVNAHDALSCAQTYLDYLEDCPGDESACAGIAVFHSHAPYADVYKIAEEACESGKQKMKELNIKNAAFIDFHICQGAIGTSLENIREKENGDVIGCPWMMWIKDEEGEKVKEVTTYKEVSEINDFLCKFSRSNIKGMAKAAKTSETDLLMEINRVYAHADEKAREKGKDKFSAVIEYLRNDPNRIRGIVYELSISHDLWFRDSNETNENNEAEN